MPIRFTGTSPDLDLIDVAAVRALTRLTDRPARRRPSPGRRRQAACVPGRSSFAASRQVQGPCRAGPQPRTVPADGMQLTASVHGSTVTAAEER